MDTKVAKDNESPREALQLGTNGLVKESKQDVAVITDNAYLSFRLRDANPIANSPKPMIRFQLEISIGVAAPRG
jgi:hypothetical protein